jgi:hypothetical protein
MVVIFLLALLIVGCGSKSATGVGGSVTPQELSDRLTQMMQDTVDATGLAQLEQTEKRELQACSTPTRSGELSDSLVIYFPAVSLEQSRELMREVYEYWHAVAPEWSREAFDIVDDGIDTKGTPAVYLHIDGFSLSASFFPDADVAEFQFGGSAPCAE